METSSTICQFSIGENEHIKEKVLNYAKRFSTFCFLDNHQYQLFPHSEECLLAAGVKRSVRANAGTALEALNEFMGKKKSWLFGHLAYDLKNELENLQSVHPDNIQFPDLYFFEPEVLIKFDDQQMEIEAADPDLVWRQINETVQEVVAPASAVQINQRFTREEYVDTVKRLKNHILRGDCYEINFCQEFYVQMKLEPVQVYNKLASLSPNPFSAFYRINDQWLICASPERFLRRKGNELISQPIKGTSRRVLHDLDLDLLSREALLNSEKDRSENVMVVDLVRNDLSRVCEEASVTVDELFGVYSFPQVHQMISTVSGVVKEDLGFADIIRASFPMGSMTGAPKKKVMELIEQYERTRRGIFSGAVGYIDPNGDFDLNVVIRSIMYNAATNDVSIQAGSGITFYSEPEQEWEECLMKVEAMRAAISQ